VAATGDPLSLASALVHLYRGTGTNARQSLHWDRSGGGALEARVREAVIVARIERLMKPRPAGSSKHLEPWRMGAAGVSLATLLFRVV